MKKYLKKYITEISCILFIFTISIINLYKARYLDIKYTSYFNKQIIWIIISFIFLFIVQKIKFKIIYKCRYHLYFISIILLFYVLIFSKEINHAKAWINIFGFTFQPSELLKFIFPIVGISLVTNKKYIMYTLIFIIPFILIFLEPDSGNSLLLFIIFIYLLINKNNKKFFIYLLISVIILTIIIITLFKYKSSIFLTFFNGKLYYRFNRILNLSNNYQIENALISIGSSKLFPIRLSKIIIYIPEGITDFMLAFSFGNLGLIINILLILSYFIFIYKIINNMKQVRCKYHKKLYGSFIVIFTYQSIYNILMNLGLVPIMGIPLPFFSYGGSNVITYMIFFSLITKKISSIEDKDNNNYKNNFHMDLVDNNFVDMD